MDISNPALKKTESIVYLFYQYSFQNGNKGYGSAIVVLLLAVIMVLTCLLYTSNARYIYSALPIVAVFMIWCMMKLVPVITRKRCAVVTAVICLVLCAGSIACLLYTSRCV